tara:strand:+ start:913 stop:1590 length:678 start_codon:yes stop_codon:yes gene_type:complete
MKRLIFFLIIISIVLYFQYPFINEINNNYDIIQYENPDKSIFENMLSEKKISVFTNIPHKLMYKEIEFENFTYDFLYTLKTKQKNELNNLIFKNLDYYKIPLCIKSNCNIEYLKNTSRINLTSQNNYRFLLLELKGTCKVTLFSPKERENLYFIKNRTNVDYWNKDLNTYPRLNDVHYIEILLHKDQMLHIPYGWVYCVECVEDDCLHISYTNESIFSFILKKTL